MTNYDSAPPHWKNPVSAPFYRPSQDRIMSRIEAFKVYFTNNTYIGQNQNFMLKSQNFAKEVGFKWLEFRIITKFDWSEVKKL